MTIVRGCCSAVRIALAAALLAALSAVASRADDRPVMASAVVLRDFMIQNVCLDAGGGVRIGHSPADADPACAAQRDLRPGERQPYHKHDHPSPEGGPREGYQRHDSYPVETAGLGTVVEHSFDFGGFEARRFGVFDKGADGGDIAVISPGAASFAATEDGGGGFQLFVGECQGAVDAAAMIRSWIIAAFDPDRREPLAGETIARLNDLKVGEQESCPPRFNAAYTRWHVMPVRYRAAPGQGTPVTLTTLISDHYGGARRDTADHVERFYFTSELGGTRWERWQNAKGNREYDAATVAAAAARFAATGRCSDAPMPEGGAEFVLIDCREWTRIVAPDDPAGDPPGFFLKALRERPGAPAFLAAPGGEK
jgi:cytochrome c556